MPAAKLVLDFDSRKFLNADGSAIIALSGKRGSIREYELAIQQEGVVMGLPDESTVKAALKKTTDPAGTYLVEADAARSGWGTGSRWFFTLDLTDEAFDDVQGKVVDFEVLMELPDGQHIPSKTVQFTVEKNVITGGS